MLYLLTHNESGAKFGGYMALNPNTANLPIDILEAIPFIGVKNSKTGDGPQDLWGQIAEWVDEHIINPIVNAAITIGGFIYHGLVVIGNFLLEARKVLAEFYMKVVDFIKHPEKLREALNVIKKVLVKFGECIVNFLKKQIGKVLKPIKDKLQEFGEWMLVKVRGLYNLITGHGGKFTLLSDIITNPLFMVLVALPGIILGVYGIISAMGMGAGMIVLELGAGVIGSAVASIFLGDYKSKKVSRPSGGILEGIEEAIGGVLGRIKLDEEDKICLYSSVIGLLISSAIAEEVDLVVKGRIFDAQQRLKELELEIGKLAEMMSQVGSGTAEFKILMKKLVGLIERQVALKMMIEDLDNQLNTNRAMWMMSVIFGILSIIIVFLPVLLPMMGVPLGTMDKAILFGLSIGTGMEGVFSGIHSLVTSGGIPGVRFASLLGLGVSFAGVGASIYKAFFKE